MEIVTVEAAAAAASLSLLVAAYINNINCRDARTLPQEAEAELETVPFDIVVLRYLQQRIKKGLFV